MHSQPKELFSSASFLNELVDLAVNAGRAIMDVYHGGNIEVTDKADDSPLTQADLGSHRVIVAGLHKLTPDIPVLSEEAATIAYADRQNWVRFWLIDPLDGTKEFIKRNGEFTVNIALIENGIPILGVVYAPALDVCYYSSRGLGAFVIRGKAAAQPIHASRPAVGETLKVVASRSHRDVRTEALLEQLGRYECVSMGSSLKLCLVAEGTAHFYPRLAPTMEWDTAAAHAIVNEAGGVVCDLNHLVLRYNKEDMHNPEFLVLPESDNQFLKSAQY
ncbi:MAG: 3'(2'),5'-bisphosphate nucleotidase CysQ [Gallionella sp.]|nr:3'(2'),5'-bisphosphate nucleotidase CysQ [Gallionella sp.]MDD4959644.1 3'(2'),5'-bisphosphate nucleotidase CysQ [Gallionella sp.]